MQQPVYRAFRGRRRDRLLEVPGCRIIDDDIRLLTHISLEVAQKACTLQRDRGWRRGCFGCGFELRRGFSDEFGTSLGLAIPDTPADLLDRFGKTGSWLRIIVILKIIRCRILRIKWRGLLGRRTTGSSSSGRRWRQRPCYSKQRGRVCGVLIVGWDGAAGRAT